MYSGKQALRLEKFKVSDIGGLDKELKERKGSGKYDNTRTPYNIELIKSKLPIKYAFKMVKKNLLLKKKKLFATIIIAAFTLIFMGFTTNLALFKESRLVANY